MGGDGCADTSAGVLDIECSYSNLYSFRGFYINGDEESYVNFGLYREIQGFILFLMGLISL